MWRIHVVPVGYAAALAVALSHAPLARAQDETAAAPDSAVSAVTRHNLPAGYLGITFTCRLKSAWSQDGLEVIHYEYPAVGSVEPESPAARAGIQPGDTILAYDGRDVRNHVIVLNKLLEPNSQLAIRLRRNGQMRDVDVSIAPRPRDFVDVSVARPARAAVPAVAPEAPGVGTASSPAEPPPPPSALAPRAPAAPWWILIGLGLSSDGKLGAFGGAHVVETTPDLREALGVNDGLLVVAVDPGTPAEESTLRAGDVIVSAGGGPVTRPRQLVRAVEREMARHTSITLEVLRRHTMRRIVLHW